MYRQEITKERQIKIDAMVLMDAAFVQSSNQVEVIVEDNTENTFDIFQEIRENTAGSSGKKATRRDD